jgi:hypothetical protein
MTSEKPNGVHTTSTSARYTAKSDISGQIRALYREKLCGMEWKDDNEL